MEEGKVASVEGEETARQTFTPLPLRTYLRPLNPITRHKRISYIASQRLVRILQLWQETPFA